MRNSLLLVSFFTSLAINAQAQIVEVYGTLSVDHLSNVTTPYVYGQSSSYTAVGGTFGGAINFLPLRVINVGVDIRDTAASGAKMWLTGLQIAAKPPRLLFKPFFRLSVGEAYLHVPQSYASTLPPKLPVDYYVYNAALGVDYRLTHFIDLRAIEIGDGRTLGGGSSNPTSFLIINSGIIIHTP